MKVIDGGVTAAKGFQAAAAAAGIKYKDRTDMALIYSEKPCKAAGTFTTNLVKAAPVKWDRAIVESKRKPQAVIVNSGIANACTGEEGMKYCEETAKEAACVLGEDTYNMISVDGDTSTNDTVLLLANGMADNKKIKYGTKEYEQFKKALHYVNETLAKEMAGDGEGATALFEVKVVGAKTKEQAKVLSKSIVCSNLTKTAIAGHDANWGRILCAMGYSGAQFDPEKVDLFFESAAGKLQIIENGVALNYSEEKATEILSEPKVTAIADLKEGDAAATAWGCDLTHEYISINADYRS